jgi:hypothetical protein
VEEEVALACPRLRDMAALGASSNVHSRDTSTPTCVRASNDGVVDHGCDDSSVD